MAASGLTKTVMTPLDLRKMATDCEKFNQTPPIQADEYQRLYLRITRYAPRYLGEAADEIERLRARLKAAESLIDRTYHYVGSEDIAEWVAEVRASLPPDNSSYGLEPGEPK